MYGQGNVSRTRDRTGIAALLPVHERVSGPEHPGTLTARVKLTYWTAKAK